MNRPSRWIRQRPLAETERDEDRDAPQREYRDADFGFTAGAWPQEPRRMRRHGAGGADRSHYREPGFEEESQPRQVGEFEGGARGRFGEGDMGTTAWQWNDDFRAGSRRHRGTPGFAESGRPLGVPWPASWERDHAGGAGPSWQDPAYSQSFEGRLHPSRFGDGPRTSPKGYTRSDERIKDDVCERLCRSSGVELDEVSVEVRQGCVHLEGSVPHRAMKHRIEDIVDGAIGVKDIDNRIRVRRYDERDAPKPAAESQAEDTTTRGGGSPGPAPLIGQRRG